MVTPTPRVALIPAKAFASGLRAVVQALAVMIVARAVGCTWTSPAATSRRDRGAGGSARVLLLAVNHHRRAGAVQGPADGHRQAITMPLFFASNALYPVELMPTWLQVINHINTLSYEREPRRSAPPAAAQRLDLVAQRG